MEKRKSISSPKIGMNRATSPHLLNEGEYSFQLNGNSYDEGGEKFNLTDEHSNILASKLKEGFKVIGAKNHVVRNTTYFFLTNPQTSISEIGCIINDPTFSVLPDTEDILNCQDCPEQINLQATPLENQIQTEHQVYKTLLEDSCNLCLEFSIDNPIFDIVIKEQNIGSRLFWTSTPGNKEFRSIELDDLEQYRFVGNDNCGETPQPTCLDCDKLRVFRLYEDLKTRDYSRTLGGNLPRGSYEILGAYSDQLGNEITSYTPLTPIVPIFDESNIITEQTDNNAETNFSIKVDLDVVDIRFDFYKVAVRYYTSRGVFTSFVEGIHSTSDKTIIVSNTNGQSISNTRLAAVRPFVETVDGATASNNILFLNGVREREPINLQPVVSLMGLGVQWMSFRAKEDLYTNADSYRYLGFNRDENVALSIDFGFNDGYRTNPFVFVPRPATPQELEDFTMQGDDYDSIVSLVRNCDSIDRNRRWQFYNTATDEGFCPLNENIETTIQRENVTTFTSVVVPSVPAGSIPNLELDQETNFIDLETFIEENRVDNLSVLGPIAPFIDPDNLTTFNNVPELPVSTCSDFVLGEELVSVTNIENGGLEFSFPPDSSSYVSIPPPSNTNIYGIDPQTGGSEIDYDFSYTYSTSFATSDPNIDIDGFDFTINFLVALTPFIRRRNQVNFNTSCRQSQDLQRVTDGSFNNLFGSFYHSNQGAFVLDDLLDQDVDMPLSVVQGDVTVGEGAFLDKLHTNALWFRTETFGRDRFYINISEESNCARETINFAGISSLTFPLRNRTSLVRVSIFTGCNATAPIFSEILDLDDVNFIDIDSSIISMLTSDNLFISVEAPIIASRGFGEDWEDLLVAVADLATNDARFGVNPLNAESFAAFTAFTNSFVDTFIANLPCAAWNIVDRDEEPDSVSITWDRIDLEKNQEYSTSCNFEVPVLQDCAPVPFKHGELGYYESTNLYDDNEELYDSSNLIIDKSRITNTELLTKLQVYTETEDLTTITLSEEADFRCKPIRHYKLPDNQISPFIRDNTVASNSDSIISPLGFTIDGEIINNLLDVAVDNNLITQKQRDSIINYKIYRSDSTLSRSVVASGLAFNTKSYSARGENISYFNYPFNSLGRDKYFPANTDDPFDKMQVISPEFDYFRPSLPDEMSLQGFMFGKSNSRVIPVDNHARMVILGSRARSLANTLAIIEVTSEIIIQAAEISSNANVWAIVGVSSGASLGLPAFTAAGIVAAIGVVEGLVSRVARFRFEWEQTFENLGTPHNFGFYIASGSNYNYLRTLQTDNNRLRGLSVRRYLKPGMLNVSDSVSGKVIRINNIDREEAPFFGLGDFPIRNLNLEYLNYDNSDATSNFSSQVLSSEIGCASGRSDEQLRNVASPYIAFKNYIPDQYGTIGSIRWIDTNTCIPIEETGICNGILGGDTFISRHGKKRKARMFETDLLGQADLTPFPYSFYSNYGQARYFIDFKVNYTFSNGNRLFPSIFYDVNFDCNLSGNGFYVTPPGKFYLYNIGFTNFLCETRINTNFRNARTEPQNQFFPQNSDYEFISQPDRIPLTAPENYFYNPAYLQTDILNSVFTLPEFYSREDSARIAYNRNSVIYSLPDVNENSITDPWLLYRPNDRATLESTYGDLIGIKGIESDQILMYFENALQLQNSINSFTDGSTQYNADLGNGGIFAKRAITMRTTDIGYGGSQSKHTLSCEFGHFHADIKRGQVFRYIGGTDLQEISRYSNGQPNGMDVWFKEHLPLKLIRQFPDFVNSDNPYNGIGIHWGYDSKYRRVLLTKKDYVLRTGVQLSYDPQTNTFDGGTTFQEQVDLGNLIDASWTLSYKPETGSWESYMSYTPNYYVNHTEYFQSGINSNDDRNGLWSHLLSNKSYRVFYGQKFPYIIEYPIKNEYISRRLESISWNAQLRRYHNEYDYAVIEDNPFTKINIFNNYENSGDLIPIQNNGTLSQLSRYPITNSNNTQDILISYDSYRYTTNYFYNRVKSNTNNQPIWLWDVNQINKQVNNKAVSFYGKKTLERLKGNFFTVRLERDSNTNYDLDFRWSEQVTNTES